jgi:hypothetical protein
MNRFQQFTEHTHYKISIIFQLFFYKWLMVFSTFMVNEIFGNYIFIDMIKFCKRCIL